jgi:WhiB family redox-sensing transcriptional regulator
MTDVQKVDPNLALCTQVTPDTFFPEPSDRVTAWSAKKLCARCPVLEECLAYALATNESWGIWGGTSPTDRQEIRRGLRTKEFHLKTLKESANEDDKKKGRRK